MSGLNSLDQFFEPNLRKRSFSKRKIGRRQSGGNGLGLEEMLRSKEFKERKELLIKGSQLVYAKGRIVATRLASRIRKARSKSIYD